MVQNSWFGMRLRIGYWPVSDFPFHVGLTTSNIEFGLSISHSDQGPVALPGFVALNLLWKRMTRLPMEHQQVG